VFDIPLGLQKKLKKGYLALTAAIVFFIISVVLLTLPGTAFPQENWLDKIWADKWIHIGMFSILVTLWCLALRARRNNLRKLFLTIAIVFLGYGIAMEFVQLYFIPFRSFDVGDIAADAIGCALGWLFCTRRYIKK
jgi:VanZ family protein